MRDNASYALRAARAGTGRRLALWGLLIAFGIWAWGDFAAAVLVPAPARPHWPDAAYWVAARLALEGRGALIYADRAVFAAESIRLGSIPDIFEANTPATVLPLLPFGLLPERPAYLLWLVCMLVCFGLAWGLLLAALRLAPVVRLALWALVPLYHPLRENFSWGQIYPLVLLLLVAGAVLGLPRAAAEQARGRGRRLGAGIVYGALCIVKLYYGALLLIPAMVQRRWRMLAGAGAVFGAAVLITAVWWGPQTWITAAAWSLHWNERPETAVIAYQTIQSALAHLLRYDATVNPRPLVDLPGLVTPLWLAAAALTGGVSVAALWRAGAGRAGPPGRQLLAAALPVPLAHLLAPIATEYHFALMLFPLVVAGAALADTHGRAGGARSPAYLAAWVVLGSAVLLLGPDWAFNVGGVGRWSALLHYPRLYGTLLAWGLIVVLLWQGRATASPPDAPRAA